MARLHHAAAFVIAASTFIPGIATAQPVRYDFSPLTALAAGALDGQNVNTPVPGFELLLMKEGRVVYRRSFGTWFNGRVGNADSATKTLSGAVMMSLSDAAPNPFSLDTRVSQYIPEFDGAKRNITIRQCFSHMSGLRGNNIQYNSDITLQDAALDISNDLLEFIPGTTFSYGGTSMHVAGAVAERVAGIPYTQLFQQRIAGPLGMTNTRFVLSGPDNPLVAGGCESNAPDFARFMEMLRNGGLHNGQRILSEDAVAQMFTRQTPIGVTIDHTPSQSPYTDGADYGVGVWLDERDPQGNLLGAMAAGARGFACWIDFDDQMVGAFATDLSAAGNVQQLLYLMRAAAQDAIRNPLACTANYNNDSQLNSQDYFDFLTDFFTGEADFNNDGLTNSQDFFDFLVAFFVGCS